MDVGKVEIAHTTDFRRISRGDCHVGSRQRRCVNESECETLQVLENDPHVSLTYFSSSTIVLIS